MFGSSGMLRRRRSGLFACVILAIGSSAGTAASVSDRPPARDATSRMTPEKYAEYVRLFNAEDPRYAQFYSDDIVFDHGPVYGMLRGRQAIVDFYKGIWVKIHETLQVGAVVIDNDHGLMAVELSTHLVARKPGVTTPSHPEGMKVGDEFVTRGVVIYTLRDGKIVQIRGAVEGNSFTPAVAGSAAGKARQ
jgi:ketosteroid isomerase-like protein